MGVFVVAYDLNKERETWQNDRDKLRSKIKAIPKSWIMLSESAYAIDIDASASEVFRVLAPFLDNNDQLYVITLTAPWDGRGTEMRNQWLAARLGPAG